MSGAKKILAFFSLLIVALGLLSLYWFVTVAPIKLPRSAPASIDLNEATLTKVGSDGKKIWTASAKTIFSTREKTRAEQVKLVFFQDDKENLRVDAAALSLNPETSDLDLIGQIKAISEDFTLTTENLHWNASTEILSTEATVRVEHPEMTLNGIGFEYVPKTGLGTIREDAHLAWKQKEPSQ
jgi:LPS export ABC transporter protein LptC